MKFIDIANIEVKSGNGGKGHISFRREKFVAKGGPDGGNGGKGGDLIIKGDNHLSTLLDFKYSKVYEAENGVDGGKNLCTGRNGKDRIIKVPVGTLVKNTETGEVIADIIEAGQMEIIAKGGSGGKGNAEFKNSINQAPRYAQPGIPGVEMKITLELKLLADVGLVGFPNVGKSTLISVVSAAKPKIADYHFTTLVPNLGVVKIAESKSFVIADIPGLIEGASDGKGLGHQFLRHVERTKLLVFILEAFSEDIVSEYEVLKNELYKYNPDMEYKKRIICINKTDAIDEDKRKELEDLVFEDSIKPMLISAVSHLNIENLKNRIWNLLTPTD
ncbi:MAG: GTPase ObgE [Ignavibacteriae bacterium]|nr:GTPase ObgE [Ignavibacteriota bacterium]MCB9220973.1 GTPase ObgE [Ignavibacteria bacterium]